MISNFILDENRGQPWRHHAIQNENSERASPSEQSQVRLIASPSVYNFALY
jgi:hypothetical protein